MILQTGGKLRNGELGALYNRSTLSMTLSGMNLLLTRLPLRKQSSVSSQALRSAATSPYRDRYQLLGRTIGGRRLKVIFQLKPDNVVRIITGWPL